MAAIQSNGTGGGDWSAGASWNGGIAPVAGDTVTILAGDTISVNTTGLACKTLSLSGILTWTAGATTDITFGDGTSDTIITFGATGYWRAGTAATPLTGVHTVIMSPLSTSPASVAANFSMAACNTTTSGISIVCDRTVYGVAESYTHPVTGTVYDTRRNYTQIATQINTAQANAVLSEDLKLNAGGGDTVVFPGSHASTNGTLSAYQSKTTASYNSGTKTATMTANFATQIVLNQLSGVPTSGARCYSELSVFTMRANASTKYWGYTGAASANPIFDLQNCTLKWFSGNTSGFNQLNGKFILGCVLIGPAASISNAGLGFRYSSTPLQYISCVTDTLCAQNHGPQYHHNGFFCVAQRPGTDMYNVMGAADFYQCYFQDCVQCIANSSGTTFTRCGFLQTSTASNGAVAIDCWAVAFGSNASAYRTIRSTLGRGTTLLSGTNVEASKYFENPEFLGTITNLYADVNTRAANMRYGNAGSVQSPSGASAPSTIGVKLAPGGNTTAYSSPPDAISAPPSGAVIYNRLVTTSAIAPSTLGENFRAALHEYQFVVASGTTYSFTVPLLAVSGYTATSLTSIRLILTWADGTSVTTTVSSLTAATWSLVNVAGTCPISGPATLQVYIQANVGSLYIDYPLDCDPAGYIWTNGLPQVAQTRLADSSAGTVALAVWAAQTSESTSSGSFGLLVQKLLTVAKFLGLK